MPPQLRTHWPPRHWPPAHEPSAQSWQSSVKAQSLLVLHCAGGGGGGFGALHERTHCCCTHWTPAHVPSAQIWHEASTTQSFAVSHWPGCGGGVVEHVTTHCPLKQPGCAQEPSAHATQTRSITQSATVLHCAGGGGGGGFAGAHTNWQAPATHASEAQLPLAHCGQAPTDGQSASLWQLPALPPPGLTGAGGQTKPHWPFTQPACAHVPSAQS